MSDAGSVYTEKRCCLPWTLMLTGLLSLTAGIAATLVTFVLSLTVSRAIFLLTFVALFWSLFWARYLRSNWPTGIWVDEAGIRIGDVRALRFATSDSQTVFTCSWSAVSKIAVTDRSLRSKLGRSSPSAAAGGRATTIPAWLRLLLVPFARAAVVIYADCTAAGGPRAELVDNVFSFGTPPTRWTAFTRRPSALRAALARVPGCPPVEDHIDPFVV